MKIFDVIKIGFKQYYKNKANLLYIFLISISVSLIVFCFAFSDSLNNYWNQSVKKMVDYRTFFVYYNPEEMTENEAVNKLNSYKNIESISPYTSYIINMRMFDSINNNTETNIFLFGIPNNAVKITHGNKMNKYSNTSKVMICPEDIFYESNTEQKKSINLIPYIGKEISLKFIDNDQKTEKFKLIGTYDSSTRQGKENFCYTNSNVVTTLNLSYQPEAFEKTEGIIYPLIVRINSTDNIDETLQQFEVDHFYTNGDPVVKIDTTTGDKILNLFMLISAVIIIISFTMLILVSLKYQQRQERKYAILKVIGYTDKDNIKLSFTEIFCRTISTILLTLIVVYSIVLIFQHFYIQNEVMLYGLNLKLTKSKIIICIILCIISNLFLEIIGRKKFNKKNFIESLR